MVNSSHRLNRIVLDGVIVEPALRNFLRHLLGKPAEPFTSSQACNVQHYEKVWRKAVEVMADGDGVYAAKQ
jgi:hypothetical protein